MRRRHRTVHARLWAALAIALPLVLIGAMLMRQDGPAERPAERLAPPASETAPGTAADD